MVNRSISKQTLLRLPLYLNYLKQFGENQPEHISATTISEALRLNHVVVRKDLASVSTAGKPKIGYKTADLIAELEAFLGYNDVDDAIIVGAGKLGKALLTYKGFRDCGMNIVAAFDIDEEPWKRAKADVFIKEAIPMEEPVATVIFDPETYKEYSSKKSLMR